jgi:hypothetical protein
MNERIRELAEQATEHDYTTWDSYNQKELVYYKFNKEKFALLIVRECIDIVSPYAIRMVNFDGGHPIADLKKHFGIEV